MQKHTELLLNHIYHHWGPSDFFPCEVCGNRATETHHIFRRGKYGDSANIVENLMMVCRTCHESYGDKTEYMMYLLGVHFSFLDQLGKNTAITDAYRTKLEKGDVSLNDLKVIFFEKI